MSDRLEPLICEYQESLTAVCAAGCRDESRRLHEQLANFWSAKIVSQFEKCPVAFLKKVDAEFDGGIDLHFECGGRHFAQEHTRIESWDGQLGCNETGQFERVQPPKWSELPATRQECISRALSAKLRKLADWTTRIQSIQGNCESILLLEDEDWVHSNQSLVADVLRNLLPMPEFSSLIPDRIHLIETRRHLALKGHGEPNSATLWVLKQGSSLFEILTATEQIGVVARGEIYPGHSHYAGPYVWNSAQLEWRLQGRLFSGGPDLDAVVYSD